MRHNYLIDEAIARGSNLHDLADYAYVQINDTHPSMVIPELIRLLTEKHKIKFAEAVEIVLIWWAIPTIPFWLKH